MTMRMIQLLAACEGMTEEHLASASDQVIGFLATMEEHPLTDDAYREVQRRARALPRDKFVPWSELLPKKQRRRRK